MKGTCDDADIVNTFVQSLERILYVWAIRHPASGYVQGINDLVTPFFQVFLSAYIGGSALATSLSYLALIRDFVMCDYAY